MKTRTGATGQLSRNQEGFAAIVIALVLILVLSLLTVGFAQLMRHEQTSALNKQLNSQAYYAAESGVNQAVRAINSGYFQTNPAKNTCGPITTGAGAAYFSNNKVGNSTGASYPCLLINPTPPNLQYTSIDTTTAKVIELEGIDSNGNPTTVNTIKLSWQDANGSTNFAPNCNNLYPAANGGINWSHAGILRAELIPLNNATGANNSGINRNDLINNSYTAFLCPDTVGSSSSNYAAHTGNNSGVILNGGCSTSNTPRYCSAQITGLSSLRESTYFLVLRSIYSPTTVTVTVCSSNCQNNDVLKISQAQILVDSTGKAQNVLRRIQVRVPVHNNYDIPNGTGSMQSLCKQLQVMPGSVTSGGGCTP